MKLSVVIPALQEADQIAAAVESARARDVEVIVVDGGSSDATRERAASAGARVVVSPVGATGRAGQLAEGVRSSRGDVIVFLHADTRLSAGFDEAVREAMADAGTVGGAFRFRFDQRSLAMRVVEWGVRVRVALFGTPYGDQALFVRRETLEEIGGVPQAPIMEDLDLVKALQRRGRLARLELPAVTSARRYRARGVLRTVLRHRLAAGAWMLGIDRDRVAAWYGR